MDWVEHFTSPEEMSEAIAVWRKEQGTALTHLNMRIKLYQEEESPWFFDVEHQLQADVWRVFNRENGQVYASVPINEIEWVRIRPYYRAACIGFKNFIFKVGGVVS